jgi:hypothetical protein
VADGGQQAGNSPRYGSQQLVAILTSYEYIAVWLDLWLGIHEFHRI